MYTKGISAVADLEGAQGARTFPFCQIKTRDLRPKIRELFYILGVGPIFLVQPPPSFKISGSATVMYLYMIVISSICLELFDCVLQIETMEESFRTHQNPDSKGIEKMVGKVGVSAERVTVSKSINIYC
jgi:hypothetical protein